MIETGSSPCAARENGGADCLPVPPEPFLSELTVVCFVCDAVLSVGVSGTSHGLCLPCLPRVLNSIGVAA